MLKRIAKLSLATAAALSASSSPTVERFNYAKSLQSPIIVGTTNGPTTWYRSSDDFGGIEYHLSQEFSAYSHRPIELIAYPTLSSLKRALERGEIDIVAAGSHLDIKDSDSIDLGPRYAQDETVIVFDRQKPLPQATDARYTLTVIADSHQDHHLSSRYRNDASIVIERESAPDMIGLIDKVDRNKIDYAVVTRSAYNIVRELYPSLSAITITDVQVENRWLVKSGDPQLLSEVEAFFRRRLNEEDLFALYESELPRSIPLNQIDAQIFTQRMRTRLPRYRHFLDEAANKVSLPFSLLAAMGYQESHWNPHARSYTGVRGFMMLTNVTAEELNIEDRLDPRESILGGASYLRSIFDRLPARFDYDNRVAFALASYNMGRSHVEDARVLAQRHGANPDSWEAVKPYILLLQDPQYYQSLPNGYARGKECVEYVENILQYQQVLEYDRWVQAKSNDNSIRASLTP